ncbi:virulence factor Mce-like protein [Actinocorallia herbida]|uniref:Virulence factor Mce-like protein n=1 Tax=Actinocorallia herbida TaxID=58109 RepID=A0A3N1CXE7_9ACTN|nr:MCE family protein [Actinocorallia herbida]ROO85951.1 virulence factor Mce-like protein [Actinocorallia herbida]
MTPRRALTAALLSVTLVAGLASGCALPGVSDGYRMTVYFTKSPSLYERSRVKVMGANVGIVERMRIEDHRVRVDVLIDGHVPVPADAWATISAETVIGERSVVLYPPWKPGAAKAEAGAVIPVERTEPPVEIDEALHSFTGLTEALDPEKVRGLLHTGAELVDGRGKGINDALATTADVAEDLAAQDEKIVSVAARMKDLAASLNKRDKKLRALIDAFSETSGQLASERTRLKNLLVGLEALIRKGEVIVTAYREDLPETMAQTSSLVMTLKANSGSLAQGIVGLAGVTDAISGAWEPGIDAIKIRVHLNATLRIWLQPIFDAMNWGEVPCLDEPIGNCPSVERKAGS